MQAIKGRKLRILIVGDDLQWGRSHAYKRAFEENNCEVSIFDQDRFYSIGFLNRVFNWFLRKLTVIRRSFGVQRYYGVSKLNQKLLGVVSDFSPNLVFFIKPVGIKPETIKKLKREELTVFSWYPDDMFNPRAASTYFYRAIPLYDCHFTTKSFNVPEVLEKGAKRAEFLPHAVDSEVHRPVEVSISDKKEMGADVMFIGTYADDKRAEYTEKLCRDGYDIKVYGNDWGKLPKSKCLHKKGYIQGRPVYGDSFCKVVCSSKIILAFLRRDNRDVQTSRTYEIPACKGFMLHERTGEATGLFEEGKEAEFFDSYEEMKEKIDYYLFHLKEREKIVRAGYKKVNNHDYSYGKRSEKILEVYEKIASEV